MRKSIAILAAVVAVFAFTGMAMAQNRVEVKVTSEPITYKAICDKAGGFSLEFDTATTITVGDQITIDVSYISPSDYASICKAINFEISPGGNAANTVANRWDIATIPVGATAPFYAVGAAPSAQVGDGVYFRVVAALNTQRITIDVLGTATNSVTVGLGVNDKLVLTLLDQKTNANFTTPGIWVPAPVNYTGVATSSDNTLCVNVSQWSGATVKGNMDSQADKYTFIPSDPQIAHIAPASTIALAYCQKSTPGRIACGAKGVQAIDTCISFDYETGVGYVANTHLGTNRLMISNTSPFLLTNYQIRLEILVNGLTGDHGVYWTNETILADGFDDSAAACAADVAALPAVGAQGSYTYLNGAGAATLPTAVVAAPGAVGSCDIASTTRAVSVTTNESGLGLALTNDYLMINIPQMRYDRDEVVQDGLVSVRVTLIKAPCGTIFTGTLPVGTLCAAIVNPPPTVNTLVYPYFTAMANDNWWDGIVVTNLSNATGLFTAMVYEQDGDVGKFTGSVDATGLYQNTLANALAGATKVSGTGTLGDSLCYILVCTNFTADGFAFMGSLSTNSLMANESMGYVPRVDYINDADNLTFCTTLGVTPGQ